VPKPDDARTGLLPAAAGFAGSRGPFGPGAAPVEHKKNGPGGPPFFPAFGAGYVFRPL
jgi:hypothetical protein